MTKTYPMLASLLLPAILLTCAAAKAEDRVQSSLQSGERITTIFEPLNVNGPFAGEPHCLVCENGASPVAMIFARQASPVLMRLVSKLDAATDQNSKQQMGSFVVFLSEEKNLPERLKESAKKQALKHVVLCIDKPDGPDGFKVAKEAEVTVVLYRDYLVKANHAFKQGELTDQAAEKILADLPKILAEKK